MSLMVITGGSRGIGRATVLGAAARGWDVVFSYARDRAAADAVVAAAQAHDVRCEAVQGDARDEAHLADLFSERHLPEQCVHALLDGLARMNVGGCRGQ